MAARVGADHVDLAERVGLARRLGRVHLGPAEPGQAVVVERERGSPRGRTRPPARGRAACSTVQSPCSGCPAKARLLTLEPRVFVLAGTEGAHGHAVGPARAASASGSGTRIWSSSRSWVKPAARRERRRRRRRRRRGPRGHVAAAFVGDRVERRGEQLVAAPSRRPGRHRELDRPFAVVVVRRCAYATVAGVVGRRARRGRRARCRRAARPTSSSPNGSTPVAASTASASARTRATSSGAKRRARGWRPRSEGIGPSSRAARPVALPYGATLTRRTVDRRSAMRDRAVRARRAVVGRPRQPRPPAGGRLLRRAVRLGRPPEGPEEAGGYRVAMVGDRAGRRHRPGSRTPARRCWTTYVDVASADAAAAKVVAARRPGDRAADGRARRRAHGGVHRPARRGVLGVAAGPAPGRAARERAGHVVVERAASPPTSRRRRRSTARCSAGAPRRTATARGAVHRVAGRRPVGRRDDAEAADDAGRGAAALGRLLRGRRHRRRGRAHPGARRLGADAADGHRARPLRRRRRSRRRGLQRHRAQRLALVG